MKNVLVTEEAVLKQLASVVEREGLRDTALALEISPSYLCRVLAGDRRFSIQGLGDCQKIMGTWRRVKF